MSSFRKLKRQERCWMIHSALVLLTMAGSIVVTAADESPWQKMGPDSGSTAWLRSISPTPSKPTAGPVVTSIRLVSDQKPVASTPSTPTLIRPPAVPEAPPMIPPSAPIIESSPGSSEELSDSSFGSLLSGDGDDASDNSITAVIAADQKPDVVRLLEHRHAERDQNYQYLMQRLQSILNSESPVVEAVQNPQLQSHQPEEGGSGQTAGSQPDGSLTNPPDSSGDGVTSQQPDRSPDTGPSQGSTLPQAKPEAKDTANSTALLKPPIDITESTPPVNPQNPLPVGDARPSSVFADSLTAQAVVDEPVDRVGLADNLYAVGEIKIALEMYRQVETKSLPTSEQYWVQFQTASCLRRLGHAGDAQSLYRRLAGQTSAGWLAKISRWWLDQMDLRKVVEEEVTRQQETVNALTEVLNERSKQ